MSTTDTTPAPGRPAGLPGAAPAVTGLRRSAAWFVGRGAPFTVLLLLLWSAYLRTRNIDAPFWIDEGISVGVAHFPFADIPAALRLDGNPPVYYLLLHGWLRLFGDSVAAAHSLSTVFALAAVPGVFLLARRPLGTGVALGATALAATLPYLTYFGQETRMYSMVAFLSVVVAGLHLRLFDVGARRVQVALAAVLIVLLYTHTWGVFLVGGSVLAVGARALMQPDRAGRLRVVKIGFVVHLAAAVAWAPWIPILAKQASETGAPWSLKPTFTMLLEAVGSVVQPQIPAVVILCSAVFGATVIAGSAKGRVAGPNIAPQAEARVLRQHALVLVVMLVSTMLFAWFASLVSPAWANRYMGVAVGPVVLLGGILLTRTGRAPLVVLLLLVALWGTSTQGARLRDKATPEAMVKATAPELRRGDLVVSVHPEQLPVIAYGLDHRGVADGVRYATALGRQQDVRIFDWRRGLDRMKAAEPWVVADRLIRAQRPGSSILLVLPVISRGNWSGPWTKLVADNTKAWRALLQADPRLRMVGRRPVIGPAQGVFGVLFEVRP
ncbi:glycosyltransferase family 39 protein [Patulibacter sp.]|uniref:glycosyltransferase family 39 protein n=1 Tax=Patulibacter sp. TaxID=1912859 RepID=UPI00271F3DE4|nr:glycosyltransferase family 39 protein [Patulibacter sp.]MDO9408651.1 glycosyltransferase family 39 protein [Patulibacter sp.]